MARPGGWRLALGAAAFAIFTTGDLALVGLPLAVLLVGAGPRGVRDWGLVAAAALVGASGFIFPARGRLDAVIAVDEVLVTAAFAGMVLLAPTSFLVMALRAMLWSFFGTAGMAWLAWGGFPFRPLRLEAIHDTVSTLRPIVELYPNLLGLFDPLVRFVSGTIPAVLALQTLAGLALAWQLHTRLARVPLGEPLRPFREFRFADAWIWGVVAAIVVWLVPALAQLKGAALNLSVVLGALYLLRGAAIVAAFASTVGVSATALLAGAAVAAVLALPLLFILPGLWTLGLFDTWMDRRPTHTRG